MKRARLPILPMLSLLVALAGLSGLAGCHRVTTVSFQSDVQPAEIDKLVVNLHDVKRSLQLSRLDSRIGLYDLEGDKITITVWGCSGGYITLSNELDPQPYTIVGDTVLVTLSPYTGPVTPCPTLETDGGVTGEPGGSGGSGGTSGEGGMTGLGGMTGAGGSGGMGGETITGAGGNADAGAGGAGGDDSGLGAGGCDATGAGGAIDAGTCDPPSGTPDVPTFTLNDACTAYCNNFAGACSTFGIYTDVPQCQRYCTLAGWTAGTGSADRGDTIACRGAHVTMAAAMSLDQRQAQCEIAGPSGGTTSTTNSCDVNGTPCGKFCAAWAGVCLGDQPTCLAACATLPAASVSCRFNWLLAASGDRNYCPLIDLTLAATSCRPPGC